MTVEERLARLESKVLELMQAFKNKESEDSEESAREAAIGAEWCGIVCNDEAKERAGELLFNLGARVSEMSTKEDQEAPLRLFIGAHAKTRMQNYLDGIIPERSLNRINR